MKLATLTTLAAFVPPGKPAATPNTTDSYNAAAKHVRAAITGLQKLGHVMGTDGELGTVLVDLDRIAGVLAARVELETDRATKAAAAAKLAAAPKPQPSGPVDWATFDAAAVKAWPHWAAADAAGKKASYAVYRDSGMTLVAYMATTREQRQAMGRAQDDAAAAATKPVTPVAAKTAAPKVTPVTPVAAKPAAAPAPAAKPATERQQCKASKADGQRCGSRIVVADGLCKAHAKQAAAPKPAAAAKTTPTAAVNHPAAGTMLVADGKGGTRPATEADLWAALQSMTAGK